MNTQEFKAWFSGYTESIEGAPNAAQWDRIVDEIAKLTAISSAPLSNPFKPYPFQSYMVNPMPVTCRPDYLEACDPVLEKYRKITS